MCGIVGFTNLSGRFSVEEAGGFLERMNGCLLYTSPSPRDRG